MAAGIELVLQTTEPFLYMIFPMWIIDEMTGNRQWNRVLFSIGLFIGCVLALRLLQTVTVVFINMSVNGSDVKDGMAYARDCLYMEYEKLEDETVRDKQQQISLNIRENIFMDAAQRFFTNLFQLIGFSYLILMLDPVILGVMFMVIFATHCVHKKMAEDKLSWQPVLAGFTRKFDYLFQVMTAFDYAKEVRINQADTLLNRKFEQTLGEFDGENRKFLHRQLGRNLVLAGLSFAQMLVSYGYTAWSAMAGKITVGEFSMYISAIYRLSGAFAGTAAGWVELQYLSSCVEEYRAYEKLTAPQGKEKEVQGLPEEKADEPVIAFRDVCFRYPNTDRLVLDHVSLQLRKGEKLAIVGPNGAGKTTFIKLLCRLYAPTSGTITCYGVDISTIKREEYQKLLAVVFQDFKIFSFSFLENIILNQRLEESKLEQAVGNAGLRSRLAALPEGIHTNLLKEFDEAGVEFSGGENQKLAIARACYKDAPLVMMDEPTAALDAAAEHEIYEKLHIISRGKTAVFISHRLSSTRFCDHIAVFEKGTITEYGTHEELMERNGLYCEMFQKQAQYYRRREADGTVTQKRSGV